MTNLLTRLQEAEEGSRELSDEVLKVLGWGTIRNPNAPYPWIIKEPWGSRSCSRRDAPSPTQSLDDALDLAPEGKMYCVSYQPPNHCQATVEVAEYVIAPDAPKGHFVVGDATTPALALCIAILKAKGEEE